MSKKTALWAGVMALLVVAPQARAAAKEWSITLNGGVATPVSDFKDKANLGYMGGVGADFGVKENLALGVDGSFITNNASDENEAFLTGAAGTPVTAKAEMLQGGAHLKYSFPMASESSLAPYVVGGLGAYNVKNKLESSNPLFNGDDSSTKFGARGGIGLMYKTSPKVAIGIDSAYHWIDTSDDATNTKSTQFISIQAAITIGMGTPAAK